MNQKRFSSQKQTAQRELQKSEIRFRQFLSLHNCIASHCLASVLSFGLLLHHLSAASFTSASVTPQRNQALQWSMRRIRPLSSHLPGESNTHPPATTEVFELFLLHCSGEAEAVQDTGCSHLCLVCIQLLQSFIQLHQLLTLG